MVVAVAVGAQVYVLSLASVVMYGYSSALPQRSAFVWLRACDVRRLVVGGVPAGVRRQVRSNGSRMLRARCHLEQLARAEHVVLLLVPVRVLALVLVLVPMLVLVVLLVVLERVVVFCIEAGAILRRAPPPQQAPTESG